MKIEIIRESRVEKIEIMCYNVDTLKLTALTSKE